MRIAVNARLLLDDRLEGIGIVTDEVMSRIVHAHPEHDFDFYFDRRYHERFIHGPNVHPHVFPPVTRLPILIRFWLNQPVRRHVYRQKADVFLSPDGFVPVGMSTPKVVYVHDVAFARFPQYLQPRIREFYKKWMPRYLAYADHIITVSEFSKKEIMEVYDVASDKISVVYNGITAGYKPIEPEIRDFIRQRYANEHPFFVYLGAIHPRKNIATLIRAFDLFKQNTGYPHQLVLAGRKSWQTDDVDEALDQSAYKAEIHFPGYIPTSQAVELIGSAEAMIYPSMYEGFGLPLIEAMASEVPVITSHSTSLAEVAGSAALLFDPTQPEELAFQMQRLVESDALQKQLIDAGLERIESFSWDTAATAVYNLLWKFRKR